MNEELGYFEPRPWHRDNPQRPEGVGQGSIGVEFVGYSAKRRNDEVK